MNKWIKRALCWLGILLILVLSLYVFRTSILKGLGGYLIAEDPSDGAEWVFVLGGNSFDRGDQAAELYEAGKVDRVVCLGANVPDLLQVCEIDSSEAELAARIIKNKGVPSEDLEVLEKGTSTMEEALACFRYCEENGVDSAIVLSDKFHLRRVRYVFEPIFRTNDTELNFQGVPSSDYHEARWWRSEEGMIMVNNEYMKLLYYYFIKEDPRELRKKRQDEPQ